MNYDVKIDVKVYDEKNEIVFGFGIDDFVDKGAVDSLERLPLSTKHAEQTRLIAQLLNDSADNISETWM